MSDDFKIESVRNNGVDRRERSGNLPLRINQEIFTFMTQEISLNLPTEQEYLLFGREGIVDTIVPVGSRGFGKANCKYDPRDTSNNPSNVYYVIKQAQSRGLTLVADFHCHPSQTGEVMVSDGLPLEYAIGPSLNDVDSFVFDIERDFNRKPLRIIGGLMRGQLMIKAFEVIKKPSSDERAKSSFLGEADWSNEDIEMNYMYADYGKLLSLGIVTERDIQVVER